MSLNGGELHSGAVSGGRHYLPEDGVQLQTGSSRIIDFATKLRRVSIADTTVADIQVINPFQVNLIGHKPGFTTLAIWDQSGQYQERPVRIDPNGKQQVLLNTMVAELDRSAIENQGTNLALALSHAGVSLVRLPGAVATPFSPAGQRYLAVGSRQFSRSISGTRWIADRNAALARYDLRPGGWATATTSSRDFSSTSKITSSRRFSRSRICSPIPVKRQSSCPAAKFLSSSRRP